MARPAATMGALLLMAGLGACSSAPAAPSTSHAPSSTLGTPTSGAAPASPTTSAPAPSPTPSVPAAPAVVSSPADGARDVAPSTIVTVRPPAGSTLQQVAVTAADGSRLPGSLKDGQWTAATGLAPGASYTVTSTVKGVDAAVGTAKQTFTVAKPAVVATYHVLYDNQTVGVGAPVTIQFDSPVATKEQRAAIERHAQVSVAPAVEGSWGWLDNRQLMWRPAEFWKPGTKVTLAANLQGLQTGPGKFIGRNASGVFTVGPAMISTVDMKAHQMTVTRDGQVLRTIPVSTGKSSEERFVTRSGTKVIIEKNGDMTMDSATVGMPKGSPGYYKLDTKYNLRVTWTGEFLHSAPWSVGAQGNANVTHGCTNLAPSNARWMFENSTVGDVVKFTGSDRPFQPTEGIGVWEYSYDAWKKQSALAAAA